MRFPRPAWSLHSRERRHRAGGSLDREDPGGGQKAGGGGGCDLTTSTTTSSTSSVVHHWRPLGRQGGCEGPGRGWEESLLVCSLVPPLLGRAGQQISGLGGELEAQPGGKHEELRGHLGQSAQSSHPQLVRPGRGWQQLGQLGQLGQQLGDSQGQQARLWGGQGEGGVNIARDYGG